MPARRLHLAQIFARQKQLGGLQEVGLEGGVGSEDAPIASIWSCWLCAVPQLPNGKARGNPSASQQHLHLIVQGCREVGHPQISPPPPYPTCPSDPALCLPITGWFCPQPCTESRLVVLFPCTCIAQSTHSRRGGLSALPDPFSALGFLQGAKKSHSWPGAFLWQQLSHPVLQLPSQRHPSICSTSGSLLSVLL